MVALDFGKGWPGLHVKYYMAKNFKNTYVLQTINLTISSWKQSFEEETSLSIIDDENLEMKNY